MSAGRAEGKCWCCKTLRMTWGSEKAWLRSGVGEGGPGRKLREKVPGGRNRERNWPRVKPAHRENVTDCVPQNTNPTRGSSEKACVVQLQILHILCLEFVLPISKKTDRLTEVLSGAWFSPPPSLHATPVGILQSFVSMGTNLQMWFKLRPLSLQHAGFLTLCPTSGPFNQHSPSASC